MRIRVERAGLLTTVQDSGRWGHQSLGVPVSGPMDGWSHRLANSMLGNPPSAATLEITGLGPSLVFEAPSVVAIAGAEFRGDVDGQQWTAPAVLEVGAGAQFTCRDRRRGLRAYIAVPGGFRVPLVLGSRATDLRSGFGGHEGRALRDGDALFAERAAAGITPHAGPVPAPELPREDVTRLRILPGPDEDAAAAFDALAGGVFTVSHQSDRMGYRLGGASIRLERRARISAPVAMGVIQVPPSGDPILLMAERQTTGGYAAIAAVISADLPLAGQLGPGDRVSFEPCGMDAAISSLIARERLLLAREAS
jgi:antagonist of KipI